MSLILDNVSKTYDDSEHATIHDVNLEIDKGEFVCVIGKSGCGKSTLLNLISGLEMPTEGKILLDGHIITGPGRDRTVMFQENALFPWLNTIENVTFGMELAGVPRKERMEKAEYYLKMVQLYEYRNYPIHRLSGGMCQRAALARALAMESEILLMDEPFSALFDSAISNVSPIYKKAALTMGATDGLLYIKVILPASLPELIAGLKQGWSFAWRALMAGEVMTTSISLGQTLVLGRSLADINQVMLVMLVIICIGIFVDRLFFGVIEHHVRAKRGLV